MRWVCTLCKYHMGNNSNIAKSRSPVCILFLVYSRELRLYNNYLRWFITHLFQKQNGSGKFRVCSSVFTEVSLERNRFGVCHHWHSIQAERLWVVECGGTCMAKSTSVGRNARESLAVTAFLKMSRALSVPETSALTDPAAAVMI